MTGFALSTQTRRKSYDLAPAFLDDHVERCGDDGLTIVKRSSRSVRVELDVIAWLDLESDAEYYSNPATAADMAECSGMGAYGKARSAAAIRAKLLADPFTPVELEAGRVAWEERQREQRAADEARIAEYRERRAIERELELAERAAHPEIAVDYSGRGVAGVDGSDLERLIVGARLRMPAGYLELETLGDLERAGTIAATGRYLDGASDTIMIELTGSFRRDDYAGPAGRE